MSGKTSVPVPCMDMPGCRWFWDNYNKCLDWQEKHQLAYYKARVTALEVENNLLHNQMLHLAEQNDQLMVQNHRLVNGVNPGSLLDSYSFYDRHQEYVQPYTHVHMDYYNNGIQQSAEQMNVCSDNSSDNGDDNIRDGDDDTDLNFELCEEYLKYMEISYRHKMEMKKLNEKNDEKKQGTDGVSDKKKVSGSKCDNVRTLYKKEERLKEMSLLYGEAAPKIHAMETALQLVFNKNADSLQPTLWPNIALNC